MLGKAVAGVVYALLLTVYLQRFDVTDQLPLGAGRPLGNLFQALTYRQKYEALKVQITRDALTGVYNRGFFDETLAALLARSRRTGSPVTLLMIDIDHFKQLNDAYGHGAGDQALAAVAAVLVTSSRAADLVCRYGGEEFAVLLPDTALDAGRHLAERINAAVPAGLAQHGARWSARPVTVTVGLAAFSAEAATAEELVQLADRRLYAGKTSGRNRVVASGHEAAGTLVGNSPSAAPQRTA
jgi:diguanylate cyclase (GGDEF)-like protein